MSHRFAIALAAIVADDLCFARGRINPLRAVNNDTSRLYDPAAPVCPEYSE